MLKHDQFLIASNVFTVEEIDEINEFGSLFVSRNSVDESKFIITFTFNDIIPYNLATTIYNSLQKNKQYFSYTINFENIKNSQNLLEYIVAFYKQILLINDSTLLSTLSCTLLNNNLVIYCEDKSLSIDNTKKDKLNKFLIKYYINVVNIASQVINTDDLIKKYHNDINELNKKSLNSIYTSSNDLANNEQIEDSGMIFYIREHLKPEHPYIFYINNLKGKYYIVKFFANNELLVKKISELAVNDWVEFSAIFSRDKYEKDIITGMARRIVKKPFPKEYSVEHNENEKERIELACHTRFTSQTGLCNLDDVISKVKKMENKYIGFCDTSNIQAFPEINNICSKAKITPIYGIEINVLNDTIPICVNEINKEIKDASYIIFDIETTGLSNNFHDMIEFGAIKIKNGVVSQKIDILIKTDTPLSNNIINLTHITPQLLEEKGVDRLQALKTIREFIDKDDVLIAHNGISFDIPFVNKEFLKNGFAKLNNCIIDTMQLSRAINDMKAHNLAKLCREYSIVYDDSVAHRADYDAQVLYGVWQKIVEQINTFDIKNINQLNELCLVDKKRYFKNQFPSYMNIYVKNQNALKTLYKLVSIASTETNFNEPALFKSELKKYQNDLIFCSSSFWGDVWDKACNGTDDELKETILFYNYVFVSPPSVFNYVIDKQSITMEEILLAIKRIIKMANMCNIPVIAVSNNFYVNSYEKIAFNALINSKLIGGGFNRFAILGKDNTSNMHLRTTKEMYAELGFIEDRKTLDDIIINNTHEFCNNISNVTIAKKGLFTPKIPGVEKKLKDFVNQRLLEIYGENINKEIKQRVENELSIIIDAGYSVIYWISKLLVDKSINDGYSVGSRGSVGSSLIAFLLNISEVNPLPPHHICSNCKHHYFDKSYDDGFDLLPAICPLCKSPMYGEGHDIPFETFLGVKGAEKVPDVDLNFSGQYQPIVHKYIHDMFGQMYAYKAGTVLTIKDKTAYGIAKKYFEEKHNNFSPSDAEVTWIVKKIVGVKRTTGQHAGGMVIVPKELDVFDFFPYQYPPKVVDEENEVENNVVENDELLTSWYTTHFDFKQIHDNLLKFDILGHDYPTRLHDMLELSKIKYADIKFNDPRVIDLFTSLKSINISEKDTVDLISTGTAAIPECGTDFTIKLIKEANPTCFDDLIKIQGLSHGKFVWQGNAQSLLKNNPSLKLKNVVCCREDIKAYLVKNNIPIDIAFKISEDVRKGKGVNKQYNDILLQNNIPNWYINSLNIIKYLFPKAHATAYAISAYVCAWFKIYYPLEFYSAFFNVNNLQFDYATIVKGKNAIINKLKDLSEKMFDKNEKSKISNKEKSRIEVSKTVVEMLARGYEILPISLEHSLAKDFLIIDNKILCPFCVIDNCGYEISESIVKARNEKKFISVDDLKSRTKANKKVIENFASLGILDKLPKTNQISLFDF